MFARMRVRPRRLLGIAVAVAAGAAVPAAAAGDISAPVITRAVTGSVGDGGWFRGSVNVRWTVTDPESPWTSTGCDARTLSAETTGEAMECRAASAGGSSSDGMVVRIDSTPPAVTGSALERPPDRAGWYRAPVAVRFAGIDALSGIGACATVPYAGPDSSRASVSGTCTDLAGNVSPAVGHGFRYDATGPRVVRRRGSRRANRHGWFTRPVRFRFRARDGLSGHARCAGVTYRGPEGRASVTATCTDRAGNVTTRAYRVRYDATAPGVTVRASSGARMATLRWRVTGEARHFLLWRWTSGRPATRRVVYRGRRHRFVDRRLVDGRRYRYKLVAVDRAGNRGARFYNVQLVRDGHRVLSDWPTRAVYHLPATWTYRRAPQALGPGTYTWYVWAAVRKGHRYQFGRLVGRRRFTIVPPG